MSRPDPPSASLSVHKASTLLRMGITGPRRPVDDLIDRLSADDGTIWMMAALRRGPLHRDEDPLRLLVEGSASLERLREIKEESKRLLGAASAEAPEERLGALAGYFLSIAAGLRHHAEQIGGQGRDELQPILLELATVTDERMSEMLGAAAEALD